MISVLDYGVGNLHSILNMLRKVGAEAHLVTSADEVEQASKLLLPGVGAFDNGMARLRASGMVDALTRAALDRRVPLLGICLGMQMLGRSSEEGTAEGLGYIDARSERFRLPAGSPLKVPHMGWSVVTSQRENALLDGIAGQPRFYFVHSYHVVPADRDAILATSTHGVEFVSMVRVGNIIGAQFHPEKSHHFGMELLRNFAGL